MDMATTSKERREVAGLMRGEAADFRRLSEEHGDAWTVDLGDVPAIFQDIAHYAGLDGVVRADAIFDRLADLIEPQERTCHVVDEVDMFGDRTDVHDCCGDTHIRDMFTGRTYPYCPNCGARVVNE